jgi:hypothetical protein
MHLGSGRVKPIGGDHQAENRISLSANPDCSHSYRNSPPQALNVDFDA